MRTRAPVFSVVGLLLVVLGLSLPGPAGGDDAGARPPPPPMRKVVSEHARFVLYVPVGWKVAEGATGLYWWVVASDPASGSHAVSVNGVSPTGGDLRALAGSFLTALKKRRADLEVGEARIARNGARLHCRGTFKSGSGRTMAWRGWFSLKDGRFTYTRIEAPADEMRARRALLLSLLLNVGETPGTIAEVEAEPLRTRSVRLADGSATFQLPVGWKVVPLGPGHFLAHDSRERYAFMIANARAISPRMGVRPEGVAVSPYLSPHDGLVFFAAQMGLLRNARMVQVNRRPELARLQATRYTAGPVEVEDFTYVFDGKTGRCKGFSIGVSYGSHLDTGWSLTHLTATAPADEFDTLAATFRKMAESYAIDDEVAARYVLEGMIQLRAMIRRTSELVSRNADEIRQTMHAAYQERMDAWDYIDYQRTLYIRGEADWVSRAEGGTVYRSDAWGIQNRTTGERWDGQPFNYVNFRGGRGGYGDLVPIDSRKLYEAHVRRR